MKLGKKFWAILASSVGGVAVTATATVGVVSNLPKNVFAQSLVGFFDDVVEREEIAPVYNMFKKGSLQFSMSELWEEEENLLEGMSFAGKMYFSEDSFAVSDLRVDTGETEIEANIYVDSDMLYVQEEHILDGAYGIVTKDLSQDLEDSIFAYGSKSEYAIQDEELYDALIQALEVPHDKMTKDLEKISKKYLKKFWKIISENAEFESSNGKERLNGQRTSVRTVSMTIDGDDMAAILEDVYDFLEADDSLMDFFEKYEDVFALSYLDAEDKLGEPTDIGEDYEMWLKDVGDNLDKTCEYYEDNFEEITIEVATPKLSSKLLKLTVIEGKEEVFVFDFGKKGIKETNTVTLEIDGEEFVYEIENNDRSEYAATLKADGEEVIEINIDRKRDKYEVKIDEYTFKGEISTKRKLTTITLDKIEYGSSYYANAYTITTNLEIIINQKDKISKPKHFDRISDIEEEDIEKWAGEIENLGGSSATFYDGWCDSCYNDYSDYYDGDKEYCSDCYEKIMGWDGYCDICANHTYTTFDGYEYCYSCWMKR